MYKLNIIVHVPILDTKYDVFIPIDKKIGTVTYLLKKGINEIAMGTFPLEKDIEIFNKISGKKYDKNILLKETDLKNGESIILI